jgi:glutathione synthase/RimK-type ligase-like ATP-grasp enzyme
MENEKAEVMSDIKNRLLKTTINDENTALNVMVSFLNLAQRRGIFSIDESAKIWECINKFQKN